MEAKFKIKDRGATPRGFRRVFNAASKDSWFETAFHFHATLRDNRFTHKHAREAGYGERKKSYTERKFRQHGHTYPLVFSGATRRKMATARISSTRDYGRASYRAARLLNFRHPASKLNLAKEFKTVTQREADNLSRVYDEHLDKLLKQDNGDNR